MSGTDFWIGYRFLDRVPIFLISDWTSVNATDLTVSELESMLPTVEWLPAGPWVESDVTPGVQAIVKITMATGSYLYADGNGARKNFGIEHTSAATWLTNENKHKGSDH